MSRPAVESSLFRARRRLTEEYEELVSGSRCQRVQAIIAGAEASPIGVRDQRRVARHVSHCQPCRRHAWLAGLDLPVTADRPLRQRIAAVLPLPFFLRRRWLDEARPQGSTTAHLGGFAQWSAQLGSTVDPSWLKAAAAATAVAVAGIGAGAATRAPGRLLPAGTPLLGHDSRTGVRDDLVAAAGRTRRAAAASALAGATTASDSGAAGRSAAGSGVLPAATAGGAPAAVAGTASGAARRAGALAAPALGSAAPAAAPAVPGSSLPATPNVAATGGAAAGAVTTTAAGAVSGATSAAGAAADGVKTTADGLLGGG
jgi:hypothetical protein